MNNSQLEVMHACADVHDDGCLRMEHNSYCVTFGGRMAFLSPKEFLIVSELSRSTGRVVASETLWRCAWDQEEMFDARTLQAHVYNLHRKILPLGLSIRSDAPSGYCLFWIRRHIPTEQ